MEKRTIMEALVEKAYEKGGFNGTWLYAENGGIVSKGAFGWRDAENTLPMEEDTIFEMASITKMFTASAVMILVREGKLSLDDEYTKIFPEFPYKGATIRHLLTHTSGIPDYNVEEFFSSVLENEKRIIPCGEIINYMRKREDEPVGAPGEKFCYSDIGYTLLANAVEKCSGVRFEDFLKKRIFEPAGMKDSGIYHTRRDGRPSVRFARNMVLDGDGYVPSDVSAISAGYVVGSDGMILECSLLQNIVEDLILFRCASDEEIINFYRQIFSALADMDYRIFYIKTEDIQSNIDTVRKERSDEQGNELWFPAMLGYFNDSPYAKANGLSGEAALIGHFLHRQRLELRICEEVFQGRYTVLPSKHYTDGDLTRH